MDHIKGILSSLIENLEKKKQDGFESVLKAWDTAVYGKIHAHTQPYKVHKNILYVKVDASTWAFEINQRYKKTILKNINKVLPHTRITDLVLSVGDFEKVGKGE